MGRKTCKTGKFGLANGYSERKIPHCEINSAYFKEFARNDRLFSVALTQIGNHYMYKLTDLLALGNALSKLDATFTTDKLNLLLSAGSNQTQASYAGVLDGLRRVVQGGNVASTPIGDVSDSADSRVAYQSNLKALTDSAAFQSLTGKVTLNLAIDAGLGVKAKTDFTAAAALLTLSPITLTVNGPEGQAALDALWKTAAWNNIHQDWLSDKAAREAGSAAVNFTDVYLHDRQALLQNLITANLKDAVANPDGYLAVQGSLNADTNTRFIDLASGAMLQVNHARISPSTALNEYVSFGAENADILNGSAQNDRLYGGGENDTLTGSEGDDYLEGNAGNDTYQFTAGDGFDTVRDANGDNTIFLDGVELSGGQLVAKTTDADGNGVYVYETQDRQVIYQYDKSATGSRLTINGSIVVADFKPENFPKILLPAELPEIEPGVVDQLVTGDTNDDRIWKSSHTVSTADSLIHYHIISKGSSPDTITIRNWQANGGEKLGIILDDAPATTPTTTSTFTGDFTKLKNEEGTAYLLGSDGNYQGDGAQPGAPDVLNGTSGADAMRALDGNDGIAGLDGDDLIEGGAGDHTLRGGRGTQTAITPLAPCAYSTRTVGLDGNRNRPDKVQEHLVRRRFQYSNVGITHAHSMRLAKHKWLGKYMDAAWPISYFDESSLVLAAYGASA